MRVRKKPVEVEAYQWNGTDDNASEIIDWILSTNGSASYTCDSKDGCYYDAVNHKHHIAIRTLEGTMNANPGDWIIQGVQGEFYPCKPDIFEATYEPVGV